MPIGLINFNQFIHSSTGRVLSLSLFALFYSQWLGIADLGYRTTPIDLKLSQKYPPAVALEVIHSKAPLEESSLVDPLITVIQLRAEYPDLGLISLDELSFKMSSESLPGSSPLPSTSFQHRPSLANRSMASSAEMVTGSQPEDYFTEEEKLRLKMAHLTKEDLNMDDARPKEEPTLREKIRAIIAQQERNNNPQFDNYANSTHPARTAAGNPYTASAQPLPRLPFKVRVDIEFAKDSSEALALTDKHFIDVRRFEEGIPKEAAQVNLVDGTFTINLQSTKGVVIGRLTSKNGGIDGEGKIAVLDLMNSNHPKLILKKHSSNLSKPVSAYGNDWGKISTTGSGENKNNSHGYGKEHSNNSKKSVTGNATTKQTINNSFSPTMMLAGVPMNKRVDDASSSSAPNSDASMKLFNNNFEPSSEFVLEANAAYHRPTVAISNISNRSQISLLPDRMINGLSEILLEQDISLNLDRGDSLIWGVIKDRGRPVEGATVLAGQGARTSYFGGFYLPDQTRTKTSENGMFSITLSQPGWNELLVELPDGRRVRINTVVFAGKVSQEDIEVPNGNTPLTLRSFDAFTGDPLRAHLQIQQLEQTIDTGFEGTTMIEVPKTNNLSFVLVSPEAPYEKIRLSYTQLEDYLHIPLFTKNWMDEFRTYLKISEGPQTGNVVGFIQGDDFTVEVQNKESSSKVAYFDQQGRFSNQGIAGGGFILFNLEEDEVNLTLLSKRNNKEMVRIVRPEKEWTHVINANFE